MAKKLTTDDYVNKCREIHGTYYDYSQVVYTKASNTVTIGCPIHGPFEIRASNHYRNGCSKCASEQRGKARRNTKQNVIDKATEMHNGRYDYSQWTTEYTDNASKMVIVCPIHGAFEQRISSHLSGHGCNDCGTTATTMSNVKSYSEFIADSAKVHGDVYDYSQVDYVNAKTHVTIICNNHGPFQQTPDRHVNAGGGCSKCFAGGTSGAENEIANFIESFVPVERNNRTIIHPKELDIYIPSRNLAIEYCGLYWHSTDKVGRSYHRDKLKACNAEGVRLITIFEDEWLHGERIVKQKLRSILGVDDRPRVGARKTTIELPTAAQKKRFMDQNHIQGNGPGSITIGLTHNDDFVAMMTFIDQSRGVFVLNRYATSVNAVGGFTKLLSYFCRAYAWKEIISFADLRWSDGHLYDLCGFELDKIIPPDYQYIEGTHRAHKFNYRRKYLPSKLDHFDPSLSETANCASNGIHRIHDCGKKRYIKTPK